MRGLVRAAALIPVAFMTIGATPDWNTQVVVTEGGHRVGNPDAKVQLIAFESYTCDHCATFEKQAEAALTAGYLHEGKISLEVRHIIRDPVDLTVAMLTSCGAPEKFFKNHRAFMLSQDEWIGVISKSTQAQRTRWTSGDQAARRRNITSDFGFYTKMEQLGYLRTDVDKCVNDNAKAQALAGQSAADSEKYNISGTPSFAINGLLLLGTHQWSLLQPQIDARL